MQPLQICIGPIIRIGRESWCLTYAGFFLLLFDWIPLMAVVNLTLTIAIVAIIAKMAIITNLAMAT